MIEPQTPAALRFALAGRVQGVGARGAIARWARALSLAGYVRNTLDGVEVVVEGEASLVQRFAEGLAEQLPPAAALETITQQELGVISTVPLPFGEGPEEGDVRTGSSPAPNLSLKGSGVPNQSQVLRQHVISGCLGSTEGSPQPLNLGTSLCSDPRHPTPVLNVDRAQVAQPHAPQFAILESDEHGPLSARVPPDVVACAACLAEVASADDRRHGYPFTSCTQCGPRYSIVESMPYERSATGMAGFALCAACGREYASADDRRFHAQTNACPRCGPRFWCSDSSGRRVATGDSAWRAVVKAIDEGRIVAVRGLGGYQLVVDATNQTAVLRLRQRKGRRGKPLAVMVASLDEAARCAHLDDAERRALAGPAGPITIVRVRGDAQLAASVCGGLDTVGLMLPTTPLHHLLLHHARRPLVVTSGNREGEPLAYRKAEAHPALGGIADLFLDHDRPIVHPLDDSVVRVMAGRAVTIRLARGLAPLPLDLVLTVPAVALGGHQKSAAALCNGRQTVLGPHVGDLDGLAVCGRFVERTEALARLYDADTSRLVCDRHPDYFTTRWADERSGVSNATRIERVQHHHAHVAAGMLEHGWLDRQVLGVAFDGTGFGDDGTIWGGEFLLTTVARATRVAHLRPFRLPGGERAVREPWRVAVAVAAQAAGAEAAARLEFGESRPESVLTLLDTDRFSPTTTSAGRLFDAVAALVLGVTHCEFEGQAAMLLEAACDLQARGAYRIDVRSGEPAEIDWRPLVRQVLEERDAGVSPGVMAMRFHRGLANAAAAVARRYAPMPVVAAGGVFQNRVLVELLDEAFAETSQPLGLPGLIPPNDGGLAAGQLAVALAHWNETEAAQCV